MKKRLFSFLLSCLCLVSLAAPGLCAEQDLAQSVHATLWTGWMKAEGQDVLCCYIDEYRRAPLVYNGTVYLPLRVAGTWTGTDAVWDQETKTVSLTHNGAEPAFFEFGKYDVVTPETEEMREQYRIDMAQGVTAELRRDVTVTVDGQPQVFTNVQGEPVYCLTFRDCVYLPVRGVGKLRGMETMWLYLDKGSSDICLYTPLTQEELAEGAEFIRQARQYADELRAGIDELAGMEELEYEIYFERMNELQHMAAKIVAMDLPSNRGAFTMTATIRACGKGVLEVFSDKLNPKYLAEDRGWECEDYRDSFVSGIEDDWRLLENAFVYAQRQYEIAEAQMR